MEQTTYSLPVIQGHDPISYEFMVFNRWGDLIFETQHAQIGWDGTHKGSLAQTDTYVWKLICKRRNYGRTT